MIDPLSKPILGGNKLASNYLKPAIQQKPTWPPNLEKLRVGFFIKYPIIQKN